MARQAPESLGLWACFSEVEELNSSGGVRVRPRWEASGEAGFWEVGPSHARPSCSCSNQVQRSSPAPSPQVLSSLTPVPRGVPVLPRFISPAITVLPVSSSYSSRSPTGTAGFSRVLRRNFSWKLSRLLQTPVPLRSGACRVSPRHHTWAAERSARLLLGLSVLA